MPTYPDIIGVGNKIYKKRLGAAGLYGLNEKVVYVQVDPLDHKKEILNEFNEVELFYAKHEKTRTIKTIFGDSLPYQKINDLNNKEIILNKIIELERLIANKDNLTQKDQEKLFLLLQEFKNVNTAVKRIELTCELEPYLKHVKYLHDRATLVSSLYGSVTKKIFLNEVQIPETYLCTLEDGTSIILSKKFSEKLQWDEFLTKRFKENKLSTEIKREDLTLTSDEAKILGKIYYIALLTSHWDIFNNLNLSNSGSVEKNGKRIAAIVDLGNAYAISGFSGRTQRENAFFNKKIMHENIKNMYNEFYGEAEYDKLNADEKEKVKEKTLYNFIYGRFFNPKDGSKRYDRDLYAELSENEKLEWSEEMNSPTKGFVNCMPTSGIVYPTLPRQLCPDLFNLSDDSFISKAMFEGFQDAHSDAIKHRGEMIQIIHEAVKEVLSNTLDLSKTGVQTFKDILRDEASYFDDEVPSLLEARLISLDNMISEIINKKPFQQIEQERLEAILKMQKVHVM